MIAHIQNRKDFLGANWVTDDTEDETEADGSRKPGVDKDSVRFLDYACGTGLVTRVSSDASTTPELNTLSFSTFSFPNVFRRHGSWIREGGRDKTDWGLR